LTTTSRCESLPVEEFLASDSVGQTTCLVLDIAMPGMSGPDLERELRRRQQDIPIVYITAVGDDAVRSRVLRQGAVEFLLKPFSESALVAALDVSVQSTKRSAARVDAEMSSGQPPSHAD
jgi:FixJ family two-component response regulator